MPLKTRGSVNERFSVWFSERSAAANASRRRSRRRRCRRRRARAARPRPATTCSEARCCVPASVNVSTPESNVNAARTRLSVGLGGVGLPVQAAGDHQVQREPEVALDADRDALTDAANLFHAAAFQGGRRRRGGAQQERPAYRDALEAAAEDALAEGLHVNGDVRQFGHASHLVPDHLFLAEPVDQDVAHQADLVRELQSCGCADSRASPGWRRCNR